MCAGGCLRYPFDTNTGNESGIVKWTRGFDIDGCADPAGWDVGVDGFVDLKFRHRFRGEVGKIKRPRVEGGIGHLAAI